MSLASEPKCLAHKSTDTSRDSFVKASCLYNADEEIVDQDAVFCVPMPAAGRPGPAPVPDRLYPRGALTALSFARPCGRTLGTRQDRLVSLIRGSVDPCCVGMQKPVGPSHAFPHSGFACGAGTDTMLRQIFYEPAEPHISVIWALGDATAGLDSCVKTCHTHRSHIVAPPLGLSLF